VQFKRTVTKVGSTRLVTPVWAEKKFFDYYKLMNAIAGELDKLIQLIRPVPPPSRSSFLEMYHRYSSPLYPGAAIARLTEVSKGGDRENR
jgi:hypothetical protein